MLIVYRKFIQHQLADAFILHQQRKWEKKTRTIANDNLFATDLSGNHRTSSRPFTFTADYTKILLQTSRGLSRNGNDFMCMKR
jgi:hypothetical protein